jgi:hypothetical protein
MRIEARVSEICDRKPADKRLVSEIKLSAALGEAFAAVLSDRGSNPLASTKNKN